MNMKRQLTYGSLVIDLRDDVKMNAVVDLMDSIIMCYKHGGLTKDFTYYGADGTIVEGQANIRDYAYEMGEIDDLPF